MKKHCASVNTRLEVSVIALNANKHKPVGLASLYAEELWFDSNLIFGSNLDLDYNVLL